MEGWPETESMSNESQEPCEAHKEYRPQGLLCLSMGGLFLFSCLHFLRRLWIMRPPDRGNEPVKPQNCYTVFPAKQFFHDMGQRVVGTVPSKPPWASHGRSCSEEIQNLEQTMIIIIIILAIMEDHTYKTLKVLWCWWFILWDFGIDSNRWQYF